ncbi:MAG: hypothetical protein ACFFEY_03700 [Candidatus Thorarchaeota archaeon]
MIKEPLIFLGVLIISLIMSSFLLSKNAGIFRPIAQRLFFIGVIFHELSHACMCLVVGRMPDHFKVKWRNERYSFIRSPHGAVGLDKPPNFLQAFIIAIGPLVINTWLIFLLWFGLVLNPIFYPIIKTVATFLILSLFLTASPSTGDLKYVSMAFRNSPVYSLYQVFLVFISVIILWLISVITRIEFILDFFYYLAIAAIYLLLKFTFLGIKLVVFKIKAKNFDHPPKLKFPQFSRKRYKPKKTQREW